MNSDLLISCLVSSVRIAVILSAIALVPALVTGLTVSILQAATQVQDQTLTFVPKLIAVCSVLFFAGSWGCGYYADFTAEIFGALRSLH